MREKIIKFLKEKAGKGAIVGLSGGIDSTTVMYLCVEALGAENVFGVIMPDRLTANKEAMVLAENIGIDFNLVEIGDTVELLASKLHAVDKKNIGNIKARVRMTILYFYANKLNRLVIGTGNKSELMTGYFTKYGDGGVDLLPIGDVYKTQLYDLAREIEVPSRIIEKVPSAELWPGQTDEDELGISYVDLDELLEKIGKGEEVSGEKADLVKELMKRTNHKLQMPEICKMD